MRERLSRRPQKARRQAERNANQKASACGSRAVPGGAGRAPQAGTDRGDSGASEPPPARFACPAATLRRAASRPARLAAQLRPCRPSRRRGKRERAPWPRTPAIRLLQNRSPFHRNFQKFPILLKNDRFRQKCRKKFGKLYMETINKSGI